MDSVIAITKVRCNQSDLAPGVISNSPKVDPSSVFSQTWNPIIALVNSINHRSVTSCQFTSAISVGNFKSHTVRPAHLISASTLFSSFLTSFASGASIPPTATRIFGMSANSRPGQPKPKQIHSANNQSQKANTKPESFEDAVKRAEKTFELEQEKALKTIQLLVSQGEYSSDEEDCDEEENEDLRGSISKSLQNYKELVGEDSVVVNIVETKYIEQTKANDRCLVCLERIKGADPIWQCKQCYGLLHLGCTQRWVRSSQNPNNPSKSWHCPKCRLLYTFNQAPKDYYCFCGQMKDPPVDPWLPAHTCGQLCNKFLNPPCGHTCTLLCHRFECPSCPQTITSACYCGNVTKIVRCGSQERYFSCNKICGKQHSCGHQCESPCHPPPCQPCTKTSMVTCLCGSSTTERVCTSEPIRCDKPCKKPLNCRKHVCEKGCHPKGGCGTCPMAGPRVCHCGRKDLGKIPCDEPTRSCGGTCDRPKPCGHGKCQQRCHAGSCLERDRCTVKTKKKCRCGQNSQLVECSTVEVLCQKRCDKIRNCGKHTCNKRCCPGCPPCEEICEGKLQCKNHICGLLCHNGPCYPCEKTVTLSCACGDSKLVVPCGVERKTKIPQCTSICRHPPTCHHPKRKSHICHFGLCPPCEQVCAVQYSKCKHLCKLPCHSEVPPILAPQSKKKKKASIVIIDKFPPPLRVDQVICPPCPTRLMRFCDGLHTAIDVVCSSERYFKCPRKCGNPLLCGNHACEKNCHTVTRPRDGRVIFILNRVSGANLDWDYSAPQENGIPSLPDSCESCQEMCQRPRYPPCKHPCREPCHPQKCSPCTVPIPFRCFCPRSILCTVPCKETHDFAVLQQRRSCGSPCGRELDQCKHGCLKTCHEGPCDLSENCNKKVTLKCKCGRVKKNFTCKNTLNKRDLVLCDEECKEKQRKEEEERKQKRAEMLNAEAISSSAAAREPRNRQKQKTKQAASTTKETSVKSNKLSEWVNRISVILLKLFLVIVAAVFVIVAAREIYLHPERIFGTKRKY